MFLLVAALSKQIDVLVSIVVQGIFVTENVKFLDGDMLILDESKNSFGFREIVPDNPLYW